MTYFSFVRRCNRLSLYLATAAGLFWRQNSLSSKQVLTQSKYLQPEQIQNSPCQPNGWSCLFFTLLHWLEALQWGEHGCHHLTELFKKSYPMHLRHTLQCTRSSKIATLKVPLLGNEKAAVSKQSLWNLCYKYRSEACLWSALSLSGNIQ